MTNEKRNLKLIEGGIDNPWKDTYLLISWMRKNGGYYTQTITSSALYPIRFGVRDSSEKVFWLGKFRTFPSMKEIQSLQNNLQMKLTLLFEISPIKP